MPLSTTAQDLKTFLDSCRDKNHTIGFVPTMGALHQGHLSLVQKSKQENTLTVVSIFVNPTQFDDPSDFKNYPSTLSLDVKALENIQCDVVFAPNVKEIYPRGLRSETFDFEGLELQMEGQFRKNHFNGVGTILKKLFQIVKPQRAYFGQKDFQQLQIVKKLSEKYGLDVEIVACPTFRESDGLAMSSRNIRLSKEQRQGGPGYI